MITTARRNLWAASALLGAVFVWSCGGPAGAAETSNALTANALTSNALTSNALTSNALTANALNASGLGANHGMAPPRRPFDEAGAIGVNELRAKAIVLRDGRILPAR